MLDLTRYDALTFDCYGTIIDWETGILNALRPVLMRHGVELPDDAILELYGELESAAEAGEYRRYRDILVTVMDGVAEQLGLTLTEAERHEISESVGNWPPFPDSAASLRSLARHYQLVILSNIDDELFEQSALLLPGVEFADVITAQQAGSYKPNLANFRLMTERMAASGVAQERILHVAQSLFHDHAPAKRVGLTTAWINRRHDRPGHGATPPAEATPDLEVPDLQTLARMADGAHAASR